MTDAIKARLSRAFLLRKVRVDDGHKSEQACQQDDSSARDKEPKHTPAILPFIFLHLSPQFNVVETFRSLAQWPKLLDPHSWHR
jgi:hypothetical protein